MTRKMSIKPRMKKIRWHEEPYIRRIRDAVAIVLSGKSACKVARMFSIPGRTLRRYVLKERTRLNRPRVPKSQVVEKLGKNGRKLTNGTTGSATAIEPVTLSPQSPETIAPRSDESKSPSEDQLTTVSSEHASSLVETKVRWNVEPHFSRIRKAVERVIAGQSASKVADEQGIPARTLRRYVTQARHKSGPFGDNTPTPNNPLNETHSQKSSELTVTVRTENSDAKPHVDVKPPAGVFMNPANGIHSVRAHVHTSPLKQLQSSFQGWCEL